MTTIAHFTLWSLLTLAPSLVPQTGECELDESLRRIQRIMAEAWTSVSPDRVKSLWPFELKVVGQGSGLVLASGGETCSAHFSFRQGSGAEALELWRLRLTVGSDDGQRNQLVKELAKATGPPVSERELSDLQRRSRTSLSWQTASGSVEGILTIRTIVLLQRPGKVEIMVDRVDAH